VFGAFGTTAAATGAVGSLVGGLLAGHVGIPASMYSSALLYAAAGIIAPDQRSAHRSRSNASGEEGA
jgi:hypothetical protein